MQRFLLVCFILVFAVTSVLVAKDSDSKKMPAKSQNQISQEFKVLKSEVDKSRRSNVPSFNTLNKVGDFTGGIFWVDDFDYGASRWQGRDLNIPVENKWHLTMWGALEDYSWWVADSTFGNNGGYDNQWYQVLDTDPFVVTDTNAVLTFFHRHNVELPGGEPEGYNAWDGMNARISVDSGMTWQVLPFDSYDATSLYSFGYQHGEGPGIPGWVGIREEWTMESIALKDYVKQDSVLMIRFAFASDPGWATSGAPQYGDADAFGWQIDSIEVKADTNFYFANYGAEAGMTGKSISYVPDTENIWNVMTIPADMPVDSVNLDAAPSPIHAAVLQKGEDMFSWDSTYLPEMDNVFSSLGPIHVPEMPDSIAQVYLDFDMMPYYVDPNWNTAGAYAIDSVEYWLIEVRHQDSTLWEPIWTVEQQGQTFRIVNTEEHDEWVRYTEFNGWPVNTSPYDLSEYAGENIYLRFHFYSDQDDPIGPGLLLDDLFMYAPINPPDTVENVSAIPNGADTTITVKWDWNPGLVYQVWRTTPGDQFVHLQGQTTDSFFVDTTVTDFQAYYYTIRAAVPYEGVSAWSDFGGAIVIPSVLKRFAYDDGEPDGYFDPGRYKKTAVKFSAEYYPVSFNTMLIHLDTTLVRNREPQPKGQFYVYSEDPVTGMPDTVMRYNDVTDGLLTGQFNVVRFDEKVTLDTGSVFLVYERYTRSPYLSVDKSEPIDMRTYWDDTDSTWALIDTFDAMMHVYFDTSEANYPQDTTALEDQALIADRFILAENYPNPFNPVTTIPFIVPRRAAGQDLTLTVYNILGQKIITLFDGKARPGLNKIKWEGINEKGRAVGTGIYIYQLKSGDIKLNRRMLLIK